MKLQLLLFLALTKIGFCRKDVCFVEKALKLNSLLILLSSSSFETWLWGRKTIMKENKKDVIMEILFYSTTLIIYNVLKFYEFNSHLFVVSTLFHFSLSLHLLFLCSFLNRIESVVIAKSFLVIVEVEKVYNEIFIIKNIQSKERISSTCRIGSEHRISFVY